VNKLSEPVNRLVSIQETRQTLGGLGRTHVYELIKRGELTRVHIGRRSFVTSASLASYLDRLEQQESASA
jgi:predicted DNA-binding transcriptional regulator AlpA